MHTFIYMQYVHVRKNAKCRMRLLKLLTQSCLRNLKQMNVCLYVHMLMRLYESALHKICSICLCVCTSSRGVVANGDTMFI